MIEIVALPTTSFSSAVFDLKRYNSVNRLYGGQTTSREQAEPRWSCQFTTSNLNASEVRRWRAFWDRMRGGLRGFLAHDPLQALPLAYPGGFGGMTRAGGGAFDGTADVTSFPSLNHIALGTLPAGFSIASGDMIGLIESGRYGLYRILDAVVANGSGVATVLVEPRLGLVTSRFTASAVANFLQPSCVMVPDPSSWSYVEESTRPTPASFSGEQVVE